MFLEEDGIFIIDENSKNKLDILLQQLVREWSKEGRKEREESFSPVLDALIKYVPQNKNKKVVNPGCGLGRLPFEIANLGYDSLGVEFSYQMIFLSQFLLG